GESGDTAGHSILGIRTTVKNDKEVVESIVQEQVALLNDKQILGNIALPKLGVGGSVLTWESNRPDLLSNERELNLDRDNENDGTVNLTLTTTLKKEKLTSIIPVIVTTTLAKDYVQYTFDETLKTNNEADLEG